MELSSLSTETILNVLANHQGCWAFWHDNNTISFPDVEKSDVGGFDNPITIFPGLNASKKLMQKKFEQMHKDGLIGGCPCGCRGDFEITDKGLQLINRSRTKEYSGY